MKKYREKPRTVQAQQWNKVGDHHRVQKFPDPLDPNLLVKMCKACGKGVGEHGTIESFEKQSAIVCPGDYVIKHTGGRYSTMNRIEFEERYEEINEDSDNRS